MRVLCKNCDRLIDLDYYECNVIDSEFYCADCFESLQEAEFEMSWYRDNYPVQMREE